MESKTEIAKEEGEWIQDTAQKLRAIYLEKIAREDDKGAKISMWLKDRVKCIYKSDMLWLFSPARGYWLREPESKNIIKKIVIMAVQDEGSQQLINQTVDTLAAWSVNDHTSFGTCIKGSYINLLNGILDADSYKLLPHDDKASDFLFTSFINVDYTEDINQIDFDTSLNFIYSVSHDESRQPRPDFAISLLQDIGYIFVEDNPEQKAFMYVGEGANGKSTFLNAIVNSLGTSVVSSLSLQDINDEKFRAAQIVGKIANICSDIPRKKIESDSTFKELVGGDAITVEQKFKTPFTYNGKPKLFFSANTLPPHESSYAWNRRWLIREWLRKFEDGEKDPDLLRKLTTSEAKRGWLHLMLFFRALYFKSGFIDSATPEQAGKLWQEKAKNSVAMFATEAIKEGKPDDKILAQELYDHYVEFCNKMGLSQVTAKSFYQRLPHHVTLESKRETEPTSYGSYSGKVTYYYGIEVLKINDDTIKGAGSLVNYQENNLRLTRGYAVKTMFQVAGSQVFPYLRDKIIQSLKIQLLPETQRPLTSAAQVKPQVFSDSEPATLGYEDYLEDEADYIDYLKDLEYKDLFESGEPNPDEPYYCEVTDLNSSYKGAGGA